MSAALPPLLALALLQPAPDGAPAPTEPVTAQPEGPAPLDREIPTPTPRVSARAQHELDLWESEERRLKLHAALSGGFAGAMILTGTLLFVIPALCRDPDPDFGCGSENIIPAIGGVVLLPLAAIPIGTSIYWGVRLKRHRKQRPAVRLRPGPGGLALEF